MDDLPAGGLPQEGQDRDEAAALAEMAAAPADAAEPRAAEDATLAVEDGHDLISERPPGRLKRLRQLVGSIPAARPWRWVRPGRWVRLRPDSHRRRRPATALALAVVLVLGFSAASPAPNGPVPNPSEGPIAAASGARGSGNSASSSGPGSSSYSPGTSGSNAPPSAGAIASASSPTATITFNDLLLDSSVDSAGLARTFWFVSDGSGTVSAQVVATSPMDTTKLCLTMDDTPTVCTSGATPGFTQPATTSHSRWTFTLISPNESTPTVDVAFSWPTDKPSIALAQGRFQGSPNPDSLRTLRATFKTRASGRMGVDAAWSPATVDATLTVADVSGTTPVTLDTVAYPGATSISPTYTHAVTAGRIYSMALFNASPDTSRTHLTATIAFP